MMGFLYFHGASVFFLKSSLKSYQSQVGVKFPRVTYARRIENWYPEAFVSFFVWNCYQSMYVFRLNTKHRTEERLFSPRKTSNLSINHKKTEKV